jgi:hypothetical protein
LLALSISHATCKLIIHSPPEYEGEWSTAQIFFGGQADPFEPITAELVLQNKAPSNPGAIVLLETSMPPEDRVRKFQAYSPGALLLSGYTGAVPGENTFYIQSDDTGDITVPVSDTPYATWKEIYDLVFDATSNGYTLNATLDATEDNEYVAALEQGFTKYGFRIILEILIIANVVIVGIKFVDVCRRFKTSEVKLVIPLLALLFLFIANWLRFIAVLDYGGIGNRVLPTQVKVSFVTLPNPFILSAAWITPLFWNENLVADSVKLNPWMAKMAIPIWIVCAIFFSFDYSHMIIRLQGSDEWFMASTIVYVVLSGLLAIYFIITSSRVMARLNNGLRNHRSATHRKSSLAGFAVAAALIGWTVTLACTWQLLQTAMGYVIYYFLTVLFSHLISLTLVLFFFASGAGKTRSTSMSRSTSRNFPTEMNPKKDIKDLIEYKDKKTQKMMKKTETVKVEKSMAPPNVVLAENKPKGLNQAGGSQQVPIGPRDDKKDTPSAEDDKSSIEEVSSEDNDTSSSDSEQSSSQSESGSD